MPISGLSSALLIGKNGAGKTTVGLALEILQKIGRGTNRVGELLGRKDQTAWRVPGLPVRFEIEVELEAITYAYSIAFELPVQFKELRVLSESLAAGGKPIFTRELAQVNLARTGKDKAASFLIDWHLVALPLIQEQSKQDPLFIFKQWLSRMLILRPIPALMFGESKEEILEPNVQVTNFGAWFAGVLAHAPSAYTTIDEYLKAVVPDLKDIKNPLVGTETRSLVVQFQDSVKIPFEDLSDGEKCFMICALVLAAHEAYGPVFCFWDEPDNYLALSEVGHFVMALRKGFLSGGQFIATSHNPEAIRRFSNENTFLISRRNHLEPAVVRPLSDLQIDGDLIGAITRGDLEP